MHRRGRLPDSFRRRSLRQFAALDGSATLRRVPGPGDFETKENEDDEQSWQANPYRQVAASGSPKHQANRRRKTLPIGLLFAEVFPARCCQGIIFCAAIIFRFAPFGANPSLMLETMQRGIECALIHLEDIVRNLPDSLGNSPAVHGTQRDALQNQKIYGTLDEISWLAHRSPQCMTGRYHSSCQ